MPLGRLAAHVAELPSWVSSILDHDEFDFAKIEYKPPVAKSSADLLEILNKYIHEAVETLKKYPDEHFMTTWKFRNGETIYFEQPKATVLRSFVFSHIVHHRAQLGVYLRLLDIPVPGSYGPTADEQM
jgi:uncharacterized damage-inducible protein DinB